MTIFAEMAEPELLERLHIVRADLAGRRVAVLGLGVSGRAMVRYLARRGAHVIGMDRRADVDAEDLTAGGVELRLAAAAEALPRDLDLLCLSPGADPRQAMVRAALAARVPVCGELELAGRLPARVVAITGTNGKSTTTALIGALVRARGLRAFVGGNLGEPLFGWLNSGTPVDVAVLELSSFQLETAFTFCADVAVVLNVTPDHVDRYPDMASYARAKRRAVEAVVEQGVAVLNHDDAWVTPMASVCAGRTWWFSTQARQLPGDGAVCVEDTLEGVGRLQRLGACDLRHTRLLGQHNRENAVAAFLAVHALGLTQPEGTAAVLLPGYRSFSGLAHRLEIAGQSAGVLYINDSKATNDNAAAIALRAMDRPVILLAGGRDKGAGYAQLVAAARPWLRQVVAFGEARQAIAAAFAGVVEVSVCERMRQAFEVARARASAGDVVLLAPACASFDEFANYAERGAIFKGWVQNLSGAGVASAFAAGQGEAVDG